MSAAAQSNPKLMAAYLRHLRLRCQCWVATAEDQAKAFVGNIPVSRFGRSEIRPKPDTTSDSSFS